MHEVPQSAELNGTLTSMLYSYLGRKVQNLKELLTYPQTYVGTTEKGQRDTKNMLAPLLYVLPFTCING
jgi:hypothetical protein